MNIREKFENHPVVYISGLMVTAFCAGYSVYPHINNSVLTVNDRQTIQANKEARDCTKLEELIKRKSIEIQEQKENVSMASPSSLRSKDTDPDSVYNRRLKEVKSLQQQSDMVYIQLTHKHGCWRTRFPHCEALSLCHST